MSKNFVGQGCKECDLIWPSDWDYWGNPTYGRKCPICNTNLIPLADVEPMTAKKARAAIRHHAFDAYYEQYDLDRMQVEVQTLEEKYEAQVDPSQS